MTPRFVETTDPEELVDTLFPQRSHVPLGRYNPSELDHLVETIAEARGQDPIAVRASLGNLSRPRTVEQLTENLPTKAETDAAKVPMAIPKVPIQETVVGKYLKHVLSKEELDLWLSIYREFMEAHPEYEDSPDDKDDVRAIATESCVMLRMERARMERPHTFNQNAYDSAAKRKQVARENLANRRKDRKQQQAKTHNNVTIITAAARLDKSSLDQKALIIQQDNEEELSLLSGKKVVKSIEVKTEEPVTGN